MVIIVNKYERMWAHFFLSACSHVEVVLFFAKYILSSLNTMNFSNFRLIFFLYLLHIPSFMYSLVTTLNFDVVVYGATPSGIAAAVVASNNTNLKVALLEPTSYISGMAGPGGIGLRDIFCSQTVLFEDSVIHTWLHMNDVDYNETSSPIWQPDQRIGQKNWYTLVTNPKYNIYLATNTGLLEQDGSVIMVNTNIQSIATINTLTEDPTNITIYTAKIFIDASYEGDIMVAANLSYTYGREAHDVYNESLAGVQPFTSFSQFQVPVNPYYSNGSLLFGVDESIPPVGTGDDRVMPYSYRLCVMPVSSGNTVPWPQPVNYNAEDFEVLIRYTIGLNNHSSKGPSLGDIVSTLPYNGYPSNKEHPLRYDLCESGGSAVSSDEPSSIYTAYITGNRTVRKQVSEQVKYWVMGMMYTLANHPRVPEVTRNSTSAWGLCADAWPNNNNWPELMYVREATRLIGDFVATQNNLVKGICVPNSIGLGAWTIGKYSIHIKYIILIKVYS